MASSPLLSDGTEIIVAALFELRVQFEAIELRVIAGPDAGLELVLGLPIVPWVRQRTTMWCSTDRRNFAPACQNSGRPRRACCYATWVRPTAHLSTTCGSPKPDIPADADCRLGYSRLLIRQHTEERKVAGAAPGSSGEPARLQPVEIAAESYGPVRAVAPTPTTVDLHGESGAGKELVARTLHTFSGDRGRWWCSMPRSRSRDGAHDCSAISGRVHLRDGRPRGAFRQAHTGTLFIDEIGELPWICSRRPLRVLETREVLPIGSRSPTGVDVRAITAHAPRSGSHGSGWRIPGRSVLPVVGGAYRSACAAPDPGRHPRHCPPPCERLLNCRMSAAALETCKTILARVNARNCAMYWSG